MTFSFPLDQFGNLGEVAAARMHEKISIAGPGTPGSRPDAVADKPEHGGKSPAAAKILDRSLRFTSLPTAMTCPASSLPSTNGSFGRSMARSLRSWNLKSTRSAHGKENIARPRHGRRGIHEPRAFRAAVMLEDVGAHEPSCSGHEGHRRHQPPADFRNGSKPPRRSLCRLMLLEEGARAVDGAGLQVRRLLPGEHRDLGIRAERGDVDRSHQRMRVDVVRQHQHRRPA
jgi:hypothetical protein